MRWCPFCKEVRGTTRNVHVKMIRLFAVTVSVKNKTPQLIVKEFQVDLLNSLVFSLNKKNFHESQMVKG